MFHGFSQCPSANYDLASTLQDACMQVYLFSSPGHDNALVDPELASPNSFDILGRDIPEPMYFNLSGLPTSRAPYEMFALDAAAIIGDEVKLYLGGSRRRRSPPVVAAIGLSLGAAIATHAASQSTVFSHLFHMAPFFGLAHSAPDDMAATVDSCLQGAPPSERLSQCYCTTVEQNFGLGWLAPTGSGPLCRYVQSWVEEHVPGWRSIEWSYQLLMLAARSALEFAVERADLLPAALNAALDMPLSHNSLCGYDMQRGRGGFCEYRLRHVLAVHSFAQHSMRSSLAPRRPLTVMSASTERDGRTYLGLGYQALRGLAAKGGEVHACVFRWQRGCREESDAGPSNECVVPHSMNNVAAGVARAPFFLYWNETLRSGMADFLAPGQLGVPAATWNTPFWDGSRDACVRQDVSQPSRSLVADVATRWEIVVEADRTTTLEALRTRILDGLSDMTGLDRNVLAFLHRVLAPNTRLFERGGGFGASMSLVREYAPVSPRAKVTVPLMLPAEATGVLRAVLRTAPAAALSNVMALRVESATPL